jgi:hypothetical protein
MYARMEAADVRSPRLVGTTTPDKVARAVVKAIEADRAEVIVNGMPLRPLLVLADVAPQWYARLAKAFGLRDMMRRASTAVG